MKRVLLLLLIMLVSTATGCSPLTHLVAGKSSSEEKKNEPKQTREKTTTENLEVDIPQELDGLQLENGAGRYGGNHYDINNIRTALKKIPKNASSKEIYNQLIGLIGNDYRHDIKQLEEFDTSILTMKKGPNGLQIPQLPGQKKVNIMILLDASGSMAGKVKGGEKMKLAKHAVQNFAEKMPYGANVSLTVYGHKGSNSKSDKDISCKGTEEIYPLGNYNPEKFAKSMKNLHPAGWTPLAAAMKKAKEQLDPPENAKAENLVYVVSDGEETCGGSPKQIAKELNQSNIKAVVNIVGFDVDDADQKALSQIAEAGGGKYESVENEVALNQYLDVEKDRLYDQWEKWSNAHYDNAEAIGNKKHDQLEKMSDNFYNRLEVEGNRYYDWGDYLEEKLGFDYDAVSTTKSMLSDRIDDIKSYALDKPDELQAEVLDHADKIQAEVLERADNEKSKLYDN
ncbi:vWA domain-containing protein [Marininema halotolerans]|uniref:D-amino-acid dehydrogenase n=1 Tax=Marininema halotolerans TaxID=1155944 RepID=A0A1I6T8V5_9BACL|nr:VWA domain-containing protein [Marininema halotolerans]SFS85664.1 D-amino-acid dehydrogenase [Marininema halotolerans]